MWWREVEFRWVSRERKQQYERLEAELGSVKSLKYCYHLPMKMWEGNMSHFAYACKMRYPLNLVLEKSEYLWFY